MKIILAGAIFLALIHELGVARDINHRRALYVQEHHLDVPPPPLYYRIIKRLSDIILSLIVCILILPILYAVLGLIIKITSEGKIIFKQTRYGIFGTEFTCYKFRSMYQNASSDSVNDARDERITPIGRFMRKTHLDEFPQFFNVLKGDMSIVGPRPLPDNETQKFNGNGRARLLLRPGITGLTQIKSGRTLSVEEKLQSDNAYIQNPSLFGDIYILFITIMCRDTSY